MENWAVQRYHGQHCFGWLRVSLQQIHPSPPRHHSYPDCRLRFAAQVHKQILLQNHQRMGHSQRKLETTLQQLPQIHFWRRQKRRKSPRPLLRRRVEICDYCHLLLDEIPWHVPERCHSPRSLTKMVHKPQPRLHETAQNVFSRAQQKWSVWTRACAATSDNSKNSVYVLKITWNDKNEELIGSKQASTSCSKVKRLILTES